MKLIESNLSTFFLTIIITQKATTTCIRPYLVAALVESRTETKITCRYVKLHIHQTQPFIVLVPDPDLSNIATFFPSQFVFLPFGPNLFMTRATSPTTATTAAHFRMFPRALTVAAGSRRHRFSINRYYGSRCEVPLFRRVRRQKKHRNYYKLAYKHFPRSVRFFFVWKAKNMCVYPSAESDSVGRSPYIIATHSSTVNGDR